MTTLFVSPVRPLVLAIGLAVLGGCASIQPVPLTTATLTTAAD